MTIYRLAAAVPPEPTAFGHLPPSPGSASVRPLPRTRTYAAPRSDAQPSYSTGCLVAAFLVSPALWSILILTDKAYQHTWVKVVAWIILALAAIGLLMLLLALFSRGGY